MSDTPLKAAREAGLACVGGADGKPMVPTQAMVDQEELDRKTPEVLFNEKVKSMTDAVQKHMDDLALSWGYDHILSLCSYEGNSNPKYSAEGAAGKVWRSETWWYCETELAKIATGARAEPESNEAFIVELPNITRPTIV